MCVCAECTGLEFTDGLCGDYLWYDAGASEMSPCGVGGCSSNIDLMTSESGVGATGRAWWPLVTLDLGVEHTDITTIELESGRSEDLAARSLSLDTSQMISVYLSSTKPFNAAASVLCRANITFATTSETQRIACPAGVPARYVTVARSNANMVRAMCKAVGGCIPSQHVYVCCC